MKLEIEVDIFSGRKNPVLELEGEEAEQTLNGYRGCFVRDENKNREWYAYRVDVSLRRNGNTELRFDNSCRFETLVLHSAPQGTLPESLLPK